MLFVTDQKLSYIKAEVMMLNSESRTTAKPVMAPAQDEVNGLVLKLFMTTKAAAAI